LDISAEEREELCLSVQETLYGTDNLQRLEDIKAQVDPKNLFSRRHGIGNKDVTPYVPPESFGEALTPSS
jgi:FAD/FMN-containing dehydrogenase